MDGDLHGKEVFDGSGDLLGVEMFSADVAGGGSGGFRSMSFTAVEFRDVADDDGFRSISFTVQGE